MTERQAWLRLVKAALDGDFLCNAIHRDLNYDDELRNKLLAPIERKQRRNSRWRTWRRTEGLALSDSGLALWGIDHKGRKARAAFCRAQVARIDRARARARKSSTRSR